MGIVVSLAAVSAFFTYYSEPLSYLYEDFFDSSRSGGWGWGGGSGGSRGGGGDYREKVVEVDIQVETGGGRGKKRFKRQREERVRDMIEDQEIIDRAHRARRGYRRKAWEREQDYNSDDDRRDSEPRQRRGLFGRFKWRRRRSERDEVRPISPSVARRERGRLSGSRDRVRESSREHDRRRRLSPERTRQPNPRRRAESSDRGRDRRRAVDPWDQRVGEGSRDRRGMRRSSSVDGARGRGEDNRRRSRGRGGIKLNNVRDERPRRDEDRVQTSRQGRDDSDEDPPSKSKKSRTRSDPEESDTGSDKVSKRPKRKTRRRSSSRSEDGDRSRRSRRSSSLSPAPEIRFKQDNRSTTRRRSSSDVDDNRNTRIRDESPRGTSRKARVEPAFESADISQPRRADHEYDGSEPYGSDRARRARDRSVHDLGDYPISQSQQYDRGNGNHPPYGRSDYPQGVDGRGAPFPGYQEQYLGGQQVHGRGDPRINGAYVATDDTYERLYVRAGRDPRDPTYRDDLQYQRNRHSQETYVHDDDGHSRSRRHRDRDGERISEPSPIDRSLDDDNDPCVPLDRYRRPEDDTTPGNILSESPTGVPPLRVNNVSGAPVSPVSSASPNDRRPRTATKKAHRLQSPRRRAATSNGSDNDSEAAIELNSAGEYEAPEPVVSPSHRKQRNRGSSVMQSVSLNDNRRRNGYKPVSPMQERWSQSSGEPETPNTRTVPLPGKGGERVAALPTVRHPPNDHPSHTESGVIDNVTSPVSTVTPFQDEPPGKMTAHRDGKPKNVIGSRGDTPPASTSPKFVTNNLGHKLDGETQKKALSSKNQPESPLISPNTVRPGGDRPVSGVSTLPKEEPKEEPSSEAQPLVTDEAGPPAPIIVGTEESPAQPGVTDTEKASSPSNKKPELQIRTDTSTTQWQGVDPNGPNTTYVPKPLSPVHSSPDKRILLLPQDKETSGEPPITQIIVVKPDEKPQNHDMTNSKSEAPSTSVSVSGLFRSIKERPVPFAILLAVGAGSFLGMYFFMSLATIINLGPATYSPGVVQASKAIVQRQIDANSTGSGLAASASTPAKLGWFDDLILSSLQSINYNFGDSGALLVFNLAFHCTWVLLLLYLLDKVFGDPPPKKDQSAEPKEPKEYGKITRRVLKFIFIYSWYQVVREVWRFIRTLPRRIKTFFCRARLRTYARLLIFGLLTYWFFEMVSRLTTMTLYLQNRTGTESIGAAVSELVNSNTTMATVADIGNSTASHSSGTALSSMSNEITTPTSNLYIYLDQTASRGSSALGLSLLLYIIFIPLFFYAVHSLTHPMSAKEFVVAERTYDPNDVSTTKLMVLGFIFVFVYPFTVFAVTAFLNTPASFDFHFVRNMAAYQTGALGLGVSLLLHTIGVPGLIWVIHGIWLKGFEMPLGKVKKSKIGTV